MKVKIEEIFLDEVIELLVLIRTNYRWKSPRLKRGYHPIRLNSGTFAITNICKGQTGNDHQVLQNVEIEINDRINKLALKKFEKILLANGIKFKISKKRQVGKSEKNDS